jgi:adenylate kinase
VPQQQRARLPRRVPAAEGRGRLRRLRGALYQRSDDTEDAVRTRLEEYHSKTEPIIDYYKQQGLVQTISALGKVGEVTQRAMDALRRDAA